MTDTIDQDRRPSTVEQLRPMLSARRWQWRTTPFPHVVAQDVFTAAKYAQLTHDFDALLTAQQDANYNQRHDFFGSSLFPGRCGSLELFLSPAWHALFSGLFDVGAAGYLTAGVHRHTPGSRDGFPHNDIHPENLHTRSGSDVLAFADPAPGKAVRAVAILFYLNNGPWVPGDGGETALYRDWKDSVDEPVADVPPRDNTLLAFGCNPHSYHSFRSNRKRRDSVISFVYRDVQDYRRLWGAEGLQQYAEYGRHRA